MNLREITTGPLVSVAKLIELERKLTRSPPVRGWAFRGQPKTYGTLVPSFQRVFAEKLPGAAEVIEGTLIKEFRQNYAKVQARTPDLPRPDVIGEGHDLHCLSVMQHHGVPTRLLDWTSSFWTAVYFACAGHPTENAELWYYDRTVFDKNARKNPQRYAIVSAGQGGADRPHDPDMLKQDGSGLLAELDLGLTPRMREQKAHHTLCTDIFADQVSLLRQLDASGDEGLHRVIIAGSCKKQTLQHLERKGTTASTVFPDVEGLGRLLQWQLETLLTTYFDERAVPVGEDRAQPDDASADTLQRGGFNDYVVDASLSHSISALDLEKEVIHYLKTGGAPDLKFNYLGALGARNWLDLTDDPAYGHVDIASVLRGNAEEIVRACGGAAEEIDFVSLGPGDGALDVLLLTAFQKNFSVAHYYPIDLSVELLQAAVRRVVTQGHWFKRLRIKAIHGDFTALVRYKPIYSFHSAPNFMSLIGYTLGNHIEAELVGKIREGMDAGDFLLFDARLRDPAAAKRGKATDEEVAEILKSYSHGRNNKFAFGPLEATTDARYDSMDFKIEHSRKYTTVDNAFNIVTYIENLHASFRGSRKRFRRPRLDLAVTTVYDEEALDSWISERGFAVVWKKTEQRTALFLLRKN